MGKEPKDVGKMPDDYRQGALDWLKDQHIILAIKKINREIRDFDKAEEVLKKGTTSQSDIANARLTVKRNLQILKPQLDEKIYDQVEKFALNHLEMMEKGIAPENISQAVLEYTLSHPLKAKHTDNDLKQAIDKGVEDGARVQKAIDDITLQQELAKATSFDAQLKVIEEAIDAGIVFGPKQLDKMGFTDFLMGRLKPDVQSSMASVSNTATKPTEDQFAKKVISLQKERAMVMIVSEPTRKTKPGGSIQTKVTMLDCSKPAEITLGGPEGFGTAWELRTNQRQYDPLPMTEGNLTFSVPTSASPITYQLTLRVKDSRGKIGSTTFFLDVGK